MKKTINMLSIAIIVLILVQLIMMFVPTFSLTAAPTKKVPDPQPVDYSLMSLCFPNTEEMGKIFKTMVEDYDVNTNVVNHVLAFIFGALTIAFNVMRFINDASGFETASATFVRFLMHVGTFVWAYFGITAFVESQIMQFATPVIPTVSYVAFAAAAVLGAVRLALTFAPKKKVAA